MKKFVGRTWKRKGGKREEKKNKEKSKERRKGDFSKELNSFFENLIQCVILQLITTMGR